jgi:rRNA processing protein Krr1/Pno1
MSHVDPAADNTATGPATAGRRRQNVSMSPKAIQSIRDDKIRGLLQKEMALRAELANLRTQTRTAMAEKDAAMRKLQQPTNTPTRDRLGGEFDKLLKDKDECNRQMDALRLEQSGLSRARDDLRTLDYESDTILRDVRAAESKVADHRGALEQSTATRDKLMASLQFKTVSDADDEISRIDGKIAASTKKNDMAVVRELTKAKQAAERAKKQVLASYAADEDVIKKKDALQTAQNEFESALEKRRAIEAKKNDVREKMASRRNFNEEFDKIRHKLDDIRKKMDDVKGTMRKDAKKAEKDKEEGSGANEAQSKLRACRDRQDEILKELDSIGDQVPHVEVPFTADLRQEILGRGGATLDQLRADFGVAIDFTPEKTNCLTIVGAQDDIEATKTAMEQMLNNLALCRKTATVTFEPSIAPSLIGSRGSNVERIQNISGAKIRVSASDGTATIVGTQEAVDAAKAMIEQHVSNSASIEMKFDRELRDLVVGKGGATVRKIEEESGVKKIRVDKELCVITAFGTQEAVDKVKLFYTNLLQDLAGGGMTMKVDARMVSLIIGKHGSTINEIQTATGAVINVADGGKVSIRGTKDAVNAARERIEDLTRREEIKIPFPRSIYDLLTTRPLVAPEPTADGQRQQQEERNSLLEEVKLQCNCDQVSAIRGEGMIVIRGRRENVAQAKMMLQEQLSQMRPDSQSITYPDVLTGYLTRRAGADKLTVLDRVKLEQPGVLAVDLDRKAGTITISGEKPAVEAGVQWFTTTFEKLQENIGTLTVPGHAVGAIIGNGGSTITDLQARHKADISVSREKQLVTVYSSAGQTGVEAVLADVQAIVKGEPLPSKSTASSNKK